MAETPPLGEKTVSALFALLHDFYRQELGAEEDVHRTLPFFATALGLIVASLNYSATQLPSWSAVLKSCSREQAGSFRLARRPVRLAGLPRRAVSGFRDDPERRRPGLSRIGDQEARVSACRTGTGDSRTHA